MAHGPIVAHATDEHLIGSGSGKTLSPVANALLVVDPEVVDHLNHLFLVGRGDDRQGVHGLDQGFEMIVLMAEVGDRGG